MDYPERKQLRLPGYNYSYYGIYFITLRVITTPSYLSTVESDNLVLSSFGEIVKNTWEEIPKHYSYCLLDEFVIMPDHLHGILIIMDTFKNEIRTPVTLIIRTFKTFSQRRINSVNKGQKFKWQRSFIARIINNKEELDIARKYIQMNPKKWKYKR